MQLLAFEEAVLERIAKEDGAEVESKALVRSLKTTRIRVQAAIDRLAAPDLIEVVSEFEDGSDVTLTAQGRRYVVDHDLV